MANAQKSQSSDVSELALVLPRVLIVSRRTVRKNKFVDFVGEYHLDLIVKYGAVPVIVPRVPGVHLLLDSFEPIHGVLLCEGEDIDPSLYRSSDENEEDSPSLSAEELEEIRALHSSDTAIDKVKDSIELQLARRCLERNIPYLGICRGSQVLNVACGGTLYQDVEREISKASPETKVKVKHIDYQNYDGHRHRVTVLPDTPLHEWFKDSLNDDSMEIWVNSYHHQGVKRLAERFKPMAFAPDGLVEAFYDPDAHNPEEGKFIMGLQFHPERMRRSYQEPSACPPAGENSEENDSDFDYPGCPCAYKEFVKAVISYQKKLACSKNAQTASVKLDGEMEKQRKRLVRSFSIAKLIYEEKSQRPFQSADLETGAQFLEASAKRELSVCMLEQFSKESTVEDERDEKKRLNQMGATVRNSAAYSVAQSLRRLPARQLSDLLEFYKMILNVGSHVLSEKLTSC